jgi:hypothetical protein
MGTISFEHATVVLSAKTPFPQIDQQLYRTYAIWGSWSVPEVDSWLQ